MAGVVFAGVKECDCAGAADGDADARLGNFDVNSRSIASNLSNASAIAANPRPARVQERNVRSLAWWSRCWEPVLATDLGRMRRIALDILAAMGCRLWRENDWRCGGVWKECTLDRGRGMRRI